MRVLLRDNIGTVHRLIVGNLEFEGWRKMVLPVGAKISQMDSVTGRPSYLELIAIEFIPPERFDFNQAVNREDLRTVFLDDISAVTRKKYLGRPVLKFKTQ